MSEKHVTKRNQQCWIENGEEKEYVGRVKGVTADPTLKFETFTSLASIGDLEIPTGDYETLITNVEFDNTSIADLELLTRNGGYVALRCACDVRIPDVFTGTRRNGSITTRVWGYVKNPPTSFHTKEKTPYTAQITTYRIEVSDGSGRIFEIDFVNNIRYPADEPAIV